METIMKDKFKVCIKTVGEHTSIIMDKNILEFLLKTKYMDMEDTISCQELNMKVTGVVV
jgi:hypothetical protein